MEEKADEGKSIFLKGSNKVGILLLHGWTCFTGELLPMAEYLNSLGYTVSAPLLRGHGTRPEDLVGVKWQDWLVDAEKYLTELKQHSDKIFVGGISMGGDIAMLLAEDKAVAGVIPMGAAVKYKFFMLAKSIAFLLVKIGITYRRKYYPRKLRALALERQTYKYAPVASVIEVLKLADVTRKFLPRINKPILIMQSDIDHMVSKKSPQIIFDGVSSETKEIYWVKDKYHVFAEEKSVHEKIGAFIKSNL